MSSFEIQNRTSELKKLEQGVESAHKELNRIKNLLTDSGSNKMEAQVKPGTKSQVLTEIQKEAHNRLHQLKLTIEQTLKICNSPKKPIVGRNTHFNFHGQIGKLKGDIRIVESTFLNLYDGINSVEKELLKIAGLSAPETLSSKTNELTNQMNDYKVKLESVKGKEWPLIKKNDFDFAGFDMGLAIAIALVHDWINNKKSRE